MINENKNETTFIKVLHVLGAVSINFCKDERSKNVLYIV